MNRLLTILFAMTTTTLFLGVSLGSGAYRQAEPAGNRSEIEVGKPLVTVSATSAFGLWAKEHPFDPNTYGKVGGISPATSADSKIVIYTSSLDENFFLLAAAVDAIVAKNETLKWSVVQVIDEKGAQFGGYTAEELSRRIEEISKLVEKNRIGHLSFAISASGSANLPRRLGLAGKNNALIALVGRRTNSGKSGVARWVQRVETAALRAEDIRAIAQALEKQAANE